MTEATETERSRRDLLPSLREQEFVEEPDAVRSEYRELGALIQDIAGCVVAGPAVDAWKSRVRAAIDRQRVELETHCAASERDFYRRLLDLGSQREIEPLLDEALAL